MIDLLYALLATARSSVKSQRELALENLALRPARSNTDALAFARAEIVSDQIVTRAQGKQEDSRVLQGT
jgi:hypothetical protein